MRTLKTFARNSRLGLTQLGDERWLLAGARIDASDSIQIDHSRISWLLNQLFANRFALRIDLCASTQQGGETDLLTRCEKIMVNALTILSGSAHRDLAGSIARRLNVPLGKSTTERFPDGEISVCLGEPVRGREVFIVQPTSPPVNDHLVELLAIIDACRRSAAQRITAVVPYFGYSRSDKRHGRREPITASMVALLLQAVGVDHIMSIDLHAAQIEGFFHTAVDTLSAVSVLSDALRSRLPADGAVVVSPDEGRIKMAGLYAQQLSAPVAVIHKQRQSGTETRVLRVVGEVRDQRCVIIDDMISTGGTISRSIAALLEAGARPEIYVVATHGLLLPGAREKLSHDSVCGLLVTDTVPVEPWPGMSVISIAPLIAGAIERLAGRQAGGDLFE
jgi:ribose-phosphate pyrophosphokinase